MKKSLVITGAASLALAAMPVLGAFADVTDTVILTIPSSCSVGQTTSASGTGKTMSELSAQNGETYTFDADGSEGGTIVVSCNDNSGWMVKAVGSGDDATDKTAMNASDNGTDIETGTTFSGTDSNWAFMLDSSATGVSIESTYSTWAAVPSGATKVASGSTTISEATINTGYKVYVGTTQRATTYTGKVTYTVHHPNA